MYQKKKSKVPIIVAAIVILCVLVGLAVYAFVLAPAKNANSSDSDEALVVDGTYSDRDKDPSYDDATATHITLNGTTATTDNATFVGVENSLVTIRVEGTYVVTGDFTGQIAVDCGTADKVQVVLKDVNIANNSGPCIFVKQADKVFLTLDEGSVNTLADGASYTTTSDEDGTINAALFSKDDLTINGSGSLAVTGNYVHAIRCKDDLKVTGGNFVISSKEDAIKGKDSVMVLDGNFAISAGDDAINSKGYIIIDGGTFDIATCYEGIEAELIYINGGTTSIYATDDGMNAANKTNSDEEADAYAATGRPNGGMNEPGSQAGDANCLIQINGGYLCIDAMGDAIDSNGSLEITGGTLLINGPTSNNDSALDFDLNATISGGTVLVLGPTGMAQNFTSGTQPFTFTSVSGQAGQTVAVTDASGTVLMSLKATKQFSVVQTSCASYSEGSSYNLVIGGTVSGADDHGFTQSGTVSGGSTTSISASTTATQGFGGLGAGGTPQGPGQSGDVQQDPRGGQTPGDIPGRTGGVDPNGGTGQNGGMNPSGGTNQSGGNQQRR